MEKIGIIKSRKLTLSKKHSAKNLNSHFWFAEKGEKFIFKYSTNDEYLGRTFLNEAIISQMCKFIGLPCQDANLARYAYGNVSGVKIKSFLKSGEREISFQDILDEKCNSILDDGFGEDFLEQYIYPFIPNTKKEATNLCKNHLQTSTGLKPVDGKFPTKISLEDIKFGQQNKIRLLFDIYLEKNSPAVTKLFAPKAINSICNKIFLINKINTNYNELQTFDTLTSLVTEYAENHDYTVDSSFGEQLTKILIFDYVVRQTDRHIGNISLILNGNTLRLAPLYDNGHCLMFNYNYIPHENNHSFHMKITPDLLNTAAAKKTLAQINNFVNNQYDAFIRHLLINSRDLLEFAPRNKNSNNKNCTKPQNGDASRTKIAQALLSKLSTIVQNNANLSTNPQIEKIKISNTKKINDIENAESFLALTDDQIKYILRGNTDWLNNNGIQYSPELWLKTYLYCSKEIMKDYLGQLMFYYEKTKDNKFANLFQK